MSEQNKIQNEDELWDLLTSDPVVDSKAEKNAKPAGKFEKSTTEAETAPVEAAPTEAVPTEAAPTEAAPTEAAPAVPVPKTERKLDGFFYSCMAGVAAVSVAATLLISGMSGPAPAVNTPADGTTPVSGTDAALVQTLELENAELRAQVELQKQQIVDLQAQLLDAVGTEEYLATAPTNPDGSANDEVIAAQLEAYDILSQIKAAYNDFDREAIEALIPEMDARLSYLSNEALYEYYTILEYVEQPSNG